MRDVAGFERFVAARGDGLLHLAWLLTGDQYAAQDAVQDALVRVVPHWDRIAKDGNPDAYVRRAVRTACIDAWRRRPGRELLVGEPPEVQRGDPRLEGVADQMTVAQALACLPRGQRAVVVLRFYEDLTETETARVLGCSQSTVKSQTRDALRRLRSLAPSMIAVPGREETTAEIVVLPRQSGRSPVAPAVSSEVGL